jgi:hypothetical protein
MNTLTSTASSYFQKFAKVCLLFLAFTLGAPWLSAKTPKQISLHEFVSLIPLWEVPHNSHPTIVGDEGRAYGVYQIHKIMVDDYNRITGSKVSHSVAFDPNFSFVIAFKVLQHYSEHIRKCGENVTITHLLFIWNGGGGAWKRVHNPKDDEKQNNLIRYTSRAIPIINDYINEQEKRRKPSEGTQV